jgi:hypothetical protein
MTTAAARRHDTFDRVDRSEVPIGDGVVGGPRIDERHGR